MANEWLIFLRCVLMTLYPGKADAHTAASSLKFTAQNGALQLLGKVSFAEPKMRCAWVSVAYKESPLTALFASS